MNQRRAHRHTAGRRPKGGRSDSDTRTEILAAARHVFAQHGLDGTSVREVANAARVNNAMIYYHFKNKGALYRAVLSDSFSSLLDIWNDPIFTSNISVRQKIEKYVESFIRFQLGNEELRRIMTMEFAGNSGHISWICEQYFADNYTRLVKLLKEGMKSGELKKFDPSLAVASLIGVIIHNFNLQPMAEQIHGKCVNLSSKKFVGFVTDLFFSGLALGQREF